MTQETSPSEVEQYLRMAMEEAEAAAKAGNHPYGAVLVDQEGTIVATGGNRVVEDHDPSSHAEMNAIRQACRERQTLSLKGYRLYTNGAPCTMCAAAIISTGISNVWYSAPPDSDRMLPTLEALIESASVATPSVNQGIFATEAREQLTRWSGK